MHDVKQMASVISHQQPTIGIITANYCEKLAVDSMMQDKTTFVKFKTGGKMIDVWISLLKNYFHCHLFIAPAYSRMRYRSPNFRPSVRLFVRPTVRPSTFTSKFDIYVEVFVFSTLVIAVTVKPCIVIVLDIPFKHAP